MAGDRGGRRMEREGEIKGEGNAPNKLSHPQFQFSRNMPGKIFDRPLL